MNQSLKRSLSGIAGVIFGIIVVNLLRGEKIYWGSIGTIITIAILFLLFRLGLNLYKK
ncbi:hypothetical protein [Aquibacillus kalidii]|uniref:hypothetical protein n=1 Tax=Aquibacillus kalidii TaxID=2762597 RepID=UPI0016492D25|nr:hypothetical protein [Aquibacillus kalidii]